VGKIDDYRQKLREFDDWDGFLLQESNLPGPRGNIELAQAVALEGDAPLFRRYLAWDDERAPTNSREEFLAFCGILGLGTLLSSGDRSVLPLLRESASDPRWRSREAVAMALQRFGDGDMEALLREVGEWSGGSRLEQRAVAAAVSEPRLLQSKGDTARAIQLLHDITETVEGAEDRRTEDFRVLRKGLGYCWSVVVAAYPEVGKPAMERWLPSDDPDVRWIMKENLRKKRLERTDSCWVAHWRARLGESKP
jgi:hypothetical protein